MSSKPVTATSRPISKPQDFNRLHDADGDTVEHGDDRGRSALVGQFEQLLCRLIAVVDFASAPHNPFRVDGQFRLRHCIPIASQPIRTDARAFGPSQHRDPLVPLLDQVADSISNADAPIYVNRRRGGILGDAPETDDGHVQTIDHRDAGVIVFDAREDEAIDTARVDEFFVRHMDVTIRALRK